MNDLLLGPLFAPLSGLFAGQVQPMPGDGRPTAIFKQPVKGRMRVTREGLVGDAQADRRVHGGPEKALHHFPVETYARFAQVFPEHATAFVPGAMGENLSTIGITEADICIGDIFAIGTARIQLAQPRTPCWKIDARFAADGITRYVADHGIAGWYFRVLQDGVIEVGDTLQRVEQQADAVSIAEFWATVRAHRPAREALLRIAAIETLTPAWRTKIADRAEWLARN
jgi:MOSC domain-containing protein YiiM